MTSSAHQAELEESRAKYRSLFENAAVPIWEEDCSLAKLELDRLRAAGVVDWREHFERHPEDVARCAGLIKIVDVNAEALRLFGAGSKEELVGHLSDHFAAESWSVFCEELVALAQGARSFAAEITALDRARRPLHLALRLAVAPESSDTWSRVLVSFVDITARRLAEDGLRQSKEEWERTFDAVPDMIAIIGEDHRIKRVNRAMAERVGRSPAELFGQRCLVHVHGTDAPPAGCPYELTMRDGLPHSLEMSEERLGGEFVVTTAPLRDADGRQVGCVHVARDVSAQKQAEREKQAAQEQLRQAQKMESIGRLAGGFAHDFNNILTPILGGAEELLMESIEGSPVREEALQIQDAAGRARELPRQLLAFGRRQILDLRPVDLRLAVGNFRGLLRRALREDIDLQIRLPEELGTVRADSGQIEHVLMNLVVNAQDAMPAGGVLTLIVSNVFLEEGRITSDLGLVPGPYVRLSVADTGLGMDEEITAHVFEPFFTTKEMGKGTGLGLSTVFGIVKQHGGAIGVTSAPGQGAIFDIYLPSLVDDSVAEGSAVRARRRRATIGTETIAVVEDDPAVLRTAQRILEESGFRVLAFAEASLCLASMQASSEHVHLLLTDVVMPGMNGRALYQQATLVRPGLKVLYMSGYTDDVIAKSGILDGVALVQKPFTADELAPRVREALDA